MGIGSIDPAKPPGRGQGGTVADLDDSVRELKEDLKASFPWSPGQDVINVTADHLNNTARKDAGQVITGSWNFTGALQKDGLGVLTTAYRPVKEHFYATLGTLPGIGLSTTPSLLPNWTLSRNQGWAMRDDGARFTWNGTNVRAFKASLTLTWRGSPGAAFRFGWRRDNAAIIEQQEIQDRAETVFWNTHVWTLITMNPGSYIEPIARVLAGNHDLFVIGGRMLFEALD